jgi:hypothetical protein
LKNKIHDQAFVYQQLYCAAKMVTMYTGPNERVSKSLLSNFEYILSTNLDNPEKANKLDSFLILFGQVLCQYEIADDLTEEFELCLVMRNCISEFDDDNKDWFKAYVLCNGKEYHLFHIILWKHLVQNAFAYCPFHGDIERFMSVQLDPKYG